MRARLTATMLALGLLIGCVGRQPPSPCSLPDLSALPDQAGIPPLWGPFLAKVDFLEAEQSYGSPKAILTAAGELPGPWLPSAPTVPLRVEAFDPTGGNDIGRQIFGSAADYFRLVVAAPDCRAEYPFRAVFSAFRLYAIDIDADGIKEVVLERGDAGPSPYSYRRRLEVQRLRRIPGTTPPGCRFEPIFDAPLNGLGASFVNLKEAGAIMPVAVPYTWLRRYRFTAPGENGRVGIDLCVVRGDDRVANVPGAEWGMVMQFPRLRYRYSPKLEIFELESFEFQPLEGTAAVTPAE